MSNQKQVATPKDRIAEKKAIRIQQELYLLDEKPANDANAKRRKKLQNQLDAFVSNIVGDNKPGGGRQRILDVIKQAALARNRKDRGDPPKKTVDAPTSKPNKYKREAARSLSDIKDELLRSGKYGSSDRKIPTLSEAALIGARFAKKKLQGKLFGNNKGGSILKKNVEKMSYGGMSGGRKHMYTAGGNVTDNLPNKGTRALAKTPKGRKALKNMGFDV